MVAVMPLPEEHRTGFMHMLSRDHPNTPTSTPSLYDRDDETGLTEVSGLSGYIEPSGMDLPLQTENLLMQEMHHRVSNSLQLVSSILQLQAKRSDHPEIRQALGEAAGRITAIASLNRLLHEEYHAGEIDAVQYLADMVEILQTSILDRAKGRSIKLDMPVPVRLFAKDLGHVGLILNELVTNALKYGEGHVLIRIRRISEGLEIVAEDEGKGFPADFTPVNNGGFGMRLLAALATGGQRSVIIDRSVPFGRIVVKITA